MSVEASDPSASEVNQETGTFTVTRTGSTENSLVVVVDFSGTTYQTGPFDDYDATGVTASTWRWLATIPAGKPSVDIVITPETDNYEEGNETVY